MTGTLKTHVQVSGMTCDHCVRAVTRELEGIPGVVEIAVDLPSGHVSITSSELLDPTSIDIAVREAGYELEN